MRILFPEFDQTNIRSQTGCWNCGSIQNSVLLSLHLRGFLGQLGSAESDCDLIGLVSPGEASLG